MIPVINENDTVVTDEIKVGDNDTLAALVTNLVEADALVILTDQAGLYDARSARRCPARDLIAEAIAGDERLEAMAGGVGSSLARGGMITKVLAAKRAARSGAHTVIACRARARRAAAPGARRAHRHAAACAQTHAARGAQAVARRPRQVAGRLTLDAGAARALQRDGKSLLPVGVTAVSGEFERGAVVACVEPGGREIARGLVNYSAAEARLIMRKASSEIETALGYVDEPELIHRDNLVLL